MNYYENRDLGDEQEERVVVRNVVEDQVTFIGDYWAALPEEEKERIRLELLKGEFREYMKKGE